MKYNAPHLTDYQNDQLLAIACDRTLERDHPKHLRVVEYDLTPSVREAFEANRNYYFNIEAIRTQLLMELGHGPVFTKDRSWQDHLPPKGFQPNPTNTNDEARTTNEKEQLNHARRLPR